MNDVGPVFFWLGYVFHSSFRNAFPCSVKALDVLSLFREREHLIGKLEKGFVFRKSEVDYEARKSRTGSDAECASRAQRMINLRSVVDVGKGTDRSGRAAGMAGVAGNALGAFDDDDSSLFRFPEFAVRQNGSFPLSCEHTAVEEVESISHRIHPPIC